MLANRNKKKTPLPKPQAGKRVPPTTHLPAGVARPLKKKEPQLPKQAHQKIAVARSELLMRHDAMHRAMAVREFLGHLKNHIQFLKTREEANAQKLHEQTLVNPEPFLDHREVGEGEYV